MSTRRDEKKAEKEARKFERQQARQLKQDELKAKMDASSQRMREAKADLDAARSGTLQARGLTSLRVSKGKWSASSPKNNKRGNTADYTAVLDAEYTGMTKRVHGTRVGGGAVAGGVLLGPLGAAVGAGLGAAARSSHDYITVQILDKHDEVPVFVAEVERKNIKKAQAFVEAFNASTTA